MGRADRGKNIETRSLGNIRFNVSVARRDCVIQQPGLGPVRKILRGLLSLYKGMVVTMRYLSHPSSVVTQQYPENRDTLKMFERYRGRLRLIYNAEGTHPCTACGICEMVCPNKSIRIITREGPVTGKKELDRFVWRFDTCTFCNLCVQACPFIAIDMAGDFESSVYDRRLLIYNLNTYHGPHTKALQKIEDPEMRKRAIEPNDIYSGPVPLAGTALPGIRALQGEGV